MPVAVLSWLYTGDSVKVNACAASVKNDAVSRSALFRRFSPTE
jgi:hypothetical protein